MKGDRIYLIKFENKPNIDDNWNHPLYLEISSFLDIKDLKYIGFSEKEDIFTQLVDYKVDKLCKSLIKNGFTFSKIDITTDIISGYADIFYLHKIDKLTKKIFKKFRLEYTSVNDVLDKISKRGFSSIDDIDMSILKKYNK
jgi:hypothetical protein